jgi:hypothetical protein
MSFCFTYAVREVVEFPNMRNTKGINCRLANVVRLVKVLRQGTRRRK